MLGWAFMFLLLSLIAALFGFGGIAAGAAWIAQVLFFAFLVMAVIIGILHLSGAAARTRMR